MTNFPDPDEFPNFDNVNSELVSDTPESYSGMNAHFNEEVIDDDGDQ